MAFGDRWGRDDSRIFSFGPDAATGEVDGTINGKIAVEIGVGSSKQVRASVLDLAFQPLPQKLLVLVDTPGHSTERSVVQKATILARMACSGAVARLGTGDELDVDVIQDGFADVVDQLMDGTEENSIRVFDPLRGMDTIVSAGSMSNSVRCSSCGEPANWVVTIPYHADSPAGRVLAYCERDREEKKASILAAIPLAFVTDDVFVVLYRDGWTESGPDAARVTRADPRTDNFSLLEVRDLGKVRKHSGRPVLITNQLLYQLS